MYCTHCGSLLDDKAVICPHCGVPVSGSFYSNNLPPDANATNTTPPPPCEKKAKVYNVFAILGLVFSILGMWSLVMGIAGLVCSILGYRQVNKLNGAGKGLAIAGLVVSIVAIALQLLNLLADLIYYGGVSVYTILYYFV